MEGTLFKTSDGTWYVVTGIAGFSEVTSYEIHPKYVKGYLLQDDEEGKEVKFEVVTRYVYDAIKHQSVEVPVYAILHQPVKENKKPMWTQTTTNDNLDIQEDTIVQSVIEQYFQRSQVGIKKYNTTLDRNDLSLHEWLEHAKQEAMDFVLYIQKVQTVIQNESIHIQDNKPKG
jgi:hypothetical protein